MENVLYVITGPTASGKTSKAVALANAINGEIISADSRQIYKGMDIGTGKDLNEYGTVSYHLIDICEAGYKYNLFEYLRDYNKVYNEIVSREHEVVLCGGTGLYVESVLKGIKLPPVPENLPLRNALQSKSLYELTIMLQNYKTLHNTTDVDNVKRAIRAIEIQQYYHENQHLEAIIAHHPMDNALIIGVDIDRENRRNRISQRLKTRLDDGMVAEVETLIKDKGIDPEDLIYYGLEYKFITQYVTGILSYDAMVEELEIAIHQFAKRQMTWFRGMERRGFKINWIPYDVSDKEFVEMVLDLKLKMNLSHS